MRFFLIVLICTQAASCGQKGPLRLPDNARTPGGVVAELWPLLRIDGALRTASIALPTDRQ